VTFQQIGTIQNSFYRSSFGIVSMVCRDYSCLPHLVRWLVEATLPAYVRDGRECVRKNMYRAYGSPSKLHVFFNGLKSVVTRWSRLRLCKRTDRLFTQEPGSWYFITADFNPRKNGNHVTECCKHETYDGYYVCVRNTSDFETFNNNRANEQNNEFPELK
jgi:hypothetical protein